MAMPHETKQPQPPKTAEEDVLRRMLNTPPKHKPSKPAPKRPK